MSRAQGIDLDAVQRYMAGRLAGFDSTITAEKFQTGQSNPTFLITTSAGNYVLRRKPAGALLKSAHAVDREFRVQSALSGSDVPVAKVYHLCQDPEVIGSDFYVMEHVVGRNFSDPVMGDISPAERGAVIEEMSRVLAALHDVKIGEVGLEDYGPQGNYFARQLGRWSKQYRASEVEPIEDMDALIAALDADLPEDDGQSGLVHGDYRIDNMIFAPDGADCRAVLDWELSTLGHPFADLAGVIMQWQMPPGREGRGLAGVDRAALGLPSDAEFIDRYCARRGLAGIDRFGYYLAFSFFRMAAILQGVRKRGLDGNASNPEHAARLGAYVPEFARAGLAALARA
ncbi:phosphotransferase family protein [Phaeobacter italicus]|uniref:phosphotransferase family protein n=1 Tax=Phaeobacter italicus TaxID=481446 RepID=UPI000186F974|nr:phosphotransferase family protein [Phaeobacter italicus]EEB72339.1 phosphotransferase family protein [Ruegeria sp. R11]CRL14290.1 Aminoglycoside phosphotransferase [Phaeobacter italicus]SFG24091.1 Predicted kinase, aminoglycoside phosphotransferase (APT) family [Phaeobacter italicus]